MNVEPFGVVEALDAVEAKADWEHLAHLLMKNDAMLVMMIVKMMTTTVKLPMTMLITL